MSSCVERFIVANRRRGEWKTVPLALSRLTRITGERRWRETVDLQMRWLAGAVKEYPAGYNFAMLAFLETLWPAAELVIAAQRPPEAWANILRAPRPELTVLLKTPERASELAAVAPYTGEYPISSRWTAWRRWRRF